jgi:hypothetical protein
MLNDQPREDCAIGMDTAFTMGLSRIVGVALTAGTGFVGRHLAERFAPLVGRTLPCFRVIENTGEHDSGPWLAHEAATTHVVQAKLELGQNVAAKLHKEDAVIVVVREYTESGEALTLPSPPFNATQRQGRADDDTRQGPRFRQCFQHYVV